jgi:hypothetical protein
VERWLPLDTGELARRRLAQLRASAPRIAQAAVAATLAWWLARQIPHHPRPFFAPVAAVVAMNALPGTRGRQAVELIVGVVLGIGVAGVVIALAGTGTWQLGVTVVLAMGAAVLVGGRPIVIGQAAASAILLVALHRPGAAPGRLLDALIGGGVAIVMATILFPIDPLRVVQGAARRIRYDLASALDTLADAVRRSDLPRARRALALVDAVDTRPLDDALTMAKGVVRRAPRRRWERHAVDEYATVAAELATAVPDARALVSGALRVLRSQEPLPAAAADAASALAAALRADSAQEAESAAGRAHDSATTAHDVAPSLGLAVFAHATESLGAHAARAAAAAPSARRPPLWRPGR